MIVQLYLYTLSDLIYRCFYLVVSCSECLYLVELEQYGGFLFFFKQKTAYEMRISDWSSDVCSSDLVDSAALPERFGGVGGGRSFHRRGARRPPGPRPALPAPRGRHGVPELQSLSPSGRANQRDPRAPRRRPSDRKSVV